MHGPVPEVERHRVRDLELVAGLRRVEAREGSRLAALGVVRASRAALGEELEEADEEDDLPLARLGDLVPELGRGGGRVVTRDVDRELDAVGMEAVADEGGHGDAAVLDLGVAEPADGVLVAAAPEVGLSEVERVVEADDRVQPTKGNSVHLRRVVALQRPHDYVRVRYSPIISSSRRLPLHDTESHWTARASRSALVSATWVSGACCWTGATKAEASGRRARAVTFMLELVLLGSNSWLRDF